MDEVRQRLVCIHSCQGIGWKTIYKFIKFDSSLRLIFSLKEHEFSELFQMNGKNAKLFYRDLHSKSYDQLNREYDQKKIHLLVIGDEIYPPLLKQIYDPPWVLYVKGKIELLQGKCFSVVGTRNATKYGYNALNKIVPRLIENHWIIVSGLAAGIDTEAHRIAIRENGKTIAILGSGFEHIYPPQNKILAEEISSNHLLISEFPPNKKPEKWHFPLRNRIISGIAKGTLIIEAKVRSGSLITAEQALEQGRDVFAIPGSIFDANSQGTNHLIQQGAKLVIDANDIMQEL
ncbi:DNA-processing protein DprA [Calidifontibacillus oryziterrae]|uniref:DNA-processing protein DprA n=1 Tax=Calidifontibacillus oryziterrae TaxID=1191699 RepID=UPI0002F694C8|nr:DNA-processing protein DprA [Calidifontibacillus oryziterrae]